MLDITFEETKVFQEVKEDAMRQGRQKEAANLNIRQLGSMARFSLNAQLQQQIELNSEIAQSIFGTTSASKISALLNDYCNQQFGQQITACSFAYLSVGATFVVRLGDQQIVLKAYGDRHSLPALLASFRIQRSLAQTGFPCPDVLSLPQLVGKARFISR